MKIAPPPLSKNFMKGEKNIREKNEKHLFLSPQNCFLGKTIFPSIVVLALQRPSQSI